ncbi:hypothetical protein Avbf_02151 [Armadillidium vulgare]|nr:hypothetical protein Avbf_02151 [Armadillidium vulgare]
MFGSLIVRSRNDSHKNLYDFDENEHVIFITDWSDKLLIDKFLNHHHTLGYRYRFRSISNIVQNCPIEISVDNHTLIINHQMEEILNPRRYRTGGVHPRRLVL